MITGILETICRWEIQTRPSIGELEGAQVEQVKNWINDFNVEANAEYMSKLALPESAERDLLVLAFAGEALVGGLVGGTRLAWLKIHMLGISPTHRLCGIGSQLIAEAEREALGRGCRYAYVDTMCFQAPQFTAEALEQLLGRAAQEDSIPISLLAMESGKPVGTINLIENDDEIHEGAPDDTFDYFRSWLYQPGS